jgi:two-component system phosphate regulon response regulator PhoB/two-component system alkaline phosphatase synthesis response regulator PhoP
VARIIKLRGNRPRHVDLKTALAINSGSAPGPRIAVARRVM